MERERDKRESNPQSLLIPSQCATQYPRMVQNAALAPALQAVYESTIDAWEEKAQRAIREFMVACFQSVESDGAMPPELVR